MDLASSLIFLAATTISIVPPIAISALGETFAESSGVINLGVDGIMLMGAVFGFMGTYFTGNPWVGVLLGILSGATMGLLSAFLCVTFYSHQGLAGLGVYFLGFGLSSYLYRAIVGAPSTPAFISGFEPINIPLLSGIPGLGPIIFQQNVLVYILLILVPLFSILLFRTTIGLKIRSVGENPKAADTLGINVSKIRYLCVIFGAALAGLGGAYLTTASIYFFQEGMTVGRGWVAVSIASLGRWRPYRVFLAAVLFSATYAMQIWLQAYGSPIPYEFINMIPYMATLVALVLIARRVRPPEALGIPYTR